ncbi:MAG: hypothetical protein IPK60_15070 [Sandaracinaceae bacterium]|jgi:hypothetical protein|nr:hypothetical protein [Sandaracinaceae bacterium]
MRIEADALVPFPRDRVFAAYRDHAPELVDMLPNIRSVEVRDRKTVDGFVHVTYLWHGALPIPPAIASVFPENAFSWTDRLRWDDTRWLSEFTVEAQVLKEAISCSGSTRFIDLPHDRTRIEFRGNLAIDLKRVRAMPEFLAGSLSALFERFVVRQISPNVTAIGDALTRYLERSDAQTI